MKVKEIKERAELEFEPIVLRVELQSKQEAFNLWNRLGIKNHDIVEYCGWSVAWPPFDVDCPEPSVFQGELDRILHERRLL